jgi:hypothetical protein
MSDNQTITFKCLGDPEFYLASDPRRETDDDQVKFYTLDQLPGDRLKIVVENGGMVSLIQISGATKEDIQGLIEAQMMHTVRVVRVFIGQKNSATIGIINGYTHFEQEAELLDGSVTRFILRIPNKCCVNEFKRLIDY